MFVKVQPDISNAKLSRVSIDQMRAKRRFQGLHAMADRRLGYRKATACRSDPATIHDVDKIVEIVEIQCVSLSTVRLVLKKPILSRQKARHVPTNRDDIILSILRIYLFG